MKQIVDFEQAKKLYCLGIYFNGISGQMFMVRTNGEVWQGVRPWQQYMNSMPLGTYYPAPTIGELIEYVISQGYEMATCYTTTCDSTQNWWEVQCFGLKSGETFESTELIDALVELAIKIAKEERNESN